MTRMFALRMAGITLITAVVLSATVPTANGSTPCGGAGLPCCIIDSCDPGLACVNECNSGDTTAGTGSGAQICEPTCVPCGGNGEPCCSLGDCQSGLTCDLGLIIINPPNDTGSGGTFNGFGPHCVPCGDAGEPCCNGTVCNEGAFCPTIIIVPCETADAGRGSGGGGFDPCMESGGGGQLVPRTCIACGDPGQPCCPGDTCDTNALCSADLCEACGQVGEQCCPGSSCPNSQAVCVEDVCEPLPAAPLMGWTAMLGLIGVLSAVGSIGVGVRSRWGRKT